MDDYLLEVLEQQEEKQESGKTERIRNLLEETMSFPGREDHRTGPARQEAALALPEKSLGTGAQQEYPQTEITRRVLTEMEPVEYRLFAGRNERTGSTNETRSEGSGRYSMTFSEENAEKPVAGMGPEALSRFFERDARRYS